MGGHMFHKNRSIVRCSVGSLLSAAAVAACLLLAGCGGAITESEPTPALDRVPTQAAPTPGREGMVTITQADNGKTIEVHKGDSFTITLAANPTTGFRWGVDSTNEQIVAYVDTDYQPAPSSGVGGGGMQILHFKAAGTGTTPVALKYWRDFEGNASIRERFSVTIRVT
jgi:inhibitor of cysteine peptidase